MRNIDRLEEMRWLAKEADGIVFTGILTLPSGEQFEYNRLIDSSVISDFIHIPSMRRFYTEDLGYSFAKILEEHYASEDSGETQDDRPRKSPVASEETPGQ